MFDAATNTKLITINSIWIRAEDAYSVGEIYIQ